MYMSRNVRHDLSESQFKTEIPSLVFLEDSPMSTQTKSKNHHAEILKLASPELKFDVHIQTEAEEIKSTKVRVYKRMNKTKH